jgi:exodeoxyribonuclease VII small subunit
MKKSSNPTIVTTIDITENSHVGRTFEQRLERLEEIVAMLDQGEAPLEKLLSLYEEGMMLGKECGEFLQNAEQKITTLSKASAL